MILQRRAFLKGLVSALAAPAIVRFESIMPVRAPKIIPATDEQLLALLQARMDACYRIMAKNLSTQMFGDQGATGNWAINETIACLAASAAVRNGS